MNCHSVWARDWPVRMSGGRRSSGAVPGGWLRGSALGTGSGWREDAGWHSCRSCSCPCIWKRRDAFSIRSSRSVKRGWRFSSLIAQLNDWYGVAAIFVVMFECVASITISSRIQQPQCPNANWKVAKNPWSTWKDTFPMRHCTDEEIN